MLVIVSQADGVAAIACSKANLTINLRSAHGARDVVGGGAYPELIDINPGAIIEGGFDINGAEQLTFVVIDGDVGGAFF